MKTVMLGFLLSGVVLASEAALPQPHSNCTARVAYSHPVSYYKCFGDEVMVGIQSQNPQIILCGPLQVTCTADVTVAKEEKSEIVDEK